MDYCGGGPLNYSCGYIDTDICKVEYGADPYCDNQLADSNGDYNGDGTFDYGLDSTCPSNMECIEPSICNSRALPEFNGNGLFIGLLIGLVGLMVIRQKHK